MAAPLHNSKGKNVISKKDTCAYFWKQQDVWKGGYCT